MNQKSKIISFILLAVWCFLLPVNCSLAISPQELQKIEDAMPTKAVVEPAQRRKLLVFSLSQGYKHDSIPYVARALEIMGEKTGAFEVVQSEDMSIFKPENLRQFDAVCFNNTTRLEFKDPALRRSLMDFVKSGGGIIGIHAATDNFYNWPEAAEMMGGLFDEHPWNEPVAVKLDDPLHPLCEVFKGKGFEVADEIYQFKAPYSRQKLHVLLSLDTGKTDMSKEKIKRTDNDFPISWVRNWGKGRVFYCSLGHRKEIFSNPVILRYYLGGIQFALGDLNVDTAPGSSGIRRLQKLLAVIAAYEYGQSSQPLTELTDIVRSGCDSPQLREQIEKYLIDFLRSQPTMAGRQFICKQLSIIGSEESVPVLTEMLIVPETSDMARYALERIPGAVVDGALRKTLPKTAGRVKVGIINSLGRRRDVQAVGLLEKLVSDSDREVAGAAVAALGRIGGKQAAAALKKALGQAPEDSRAAVADAYLMCGDKFLTEGNTKSAMEIYIQMYAPGKPAPIRFAALRGIVAATPEKEAVGMIINVLRGNDEAMQAVAIGLVRGIPGAKIIKAAAAELPNLPVTAQVQLLWALAERGDPAAKPAVINAAKSSEADVRIAALKALGQLGDASSVTLLAQAAASATGAEQQAARGSLYRLRGSDIDAAILAAMPKAKPKVKVELIRGIARRRIYSATDILLKTAQSPDAAVRLESFRALRVVAGQEYLPVLVDILINVQDDAERSEAEKTVAAVGRKIPDKGRQAQAVLAALGTVKKVSARCSLLRALGKIGDDSALEVLRDALTDNNIRVTTAAIGALSDWPDDEPMAELLEVAQSSDNKKHQVLALRGVIRLIGLDSNRPAEETVEMYGKALKLASNVSEKKMILSALADVESFAALYMASEYLDDDALRPEAGAAMVEIANSTRRSHPQQTRILLRMVIRSSKSRSLRKQARKILKRIK